MKPFHLLETMLELQGIQLVFVFELDSGILGYKAKTEHKHINLLYAPYSANIVITDAGFKLTEEYLDFAIKTITAKLESGSTDLLGEYQFVWEEGIDDCDEIT